MEVRGGRSDEDGIREEAILGISPFGKFEVAQIGTRAAKLSFGIFPKY
jgi:hypothetical protein